jgi:endoglucanase
MLERSHARRWLVGLSAFALVAAGAGAVITTLHNSVPAHADSGPVYAGRSLNPNTKFYIPQPDHGAIQQIADLTSKGQKSEANLVQQMIQTPQAVWFTDGTPMDVLQSVKQVTQQAAGKGTVPVLVAYNVPGRDCSQYSAGGAATGDDYKAWINGFAAGLGDAKVVVLLEPDGLALLPGDSGCDQPDTYGRISLINYAAHQLLSDPNASIYLDAGHSAWHAVGDMATRLVQAGVQDVQGFFLDVSNFNHTNYEDKFGTWISDCIAFANDAEEGGWRLGHYDWCASQYYSTVCTVNPSDITTWGCTDQWYSANMGTAQPKVHFVVDTSRNGQGPWTAPADHPAGDPQVWCNPPDRGLGARPTANTGVALVDAYLWVKIPGESDGQCYRWSAGPTDPVRGATDPAAGNWFPAMALELINNANPPLS